MPIIGGGSGGGGGFAPGFEYSYAEITALVNIVSTTEATGTTVLSPAAFTPDGAPVLCEFYGIYLTGTTANNVVHVNLFEGATQITRLTVVQDNPASQQVLTLYARYRFTPTAAAHTYTVTSFVNSTTGTPQIGGAAVGTAGGPPCFVRFTKV